MSMVIRLSVSFPAIFIEFISLCEICFLLTPVSVLEFLSLICEFFHTNYISVNMLPEIINFNKTMQYRLQEYEQLFDGVETPCSEVVEVWGLTFEDLAIIGSGWQALWVLSAEECMKYKLLYPTAVIVNVVEFLWCELTARVKVIAVQEDIVIPSTLDVPVIELHPIKNQDYDETDLRAIEDWLDKCRYFFNNLWYPWDAKIDVTLSDWCESHLKSRLKMQYDLKNGIFDKSITHYLKLLLTEAKNLGAISETNFSQGDDKTAIVKRYLRRKVIKTELDLFEEPELRYGMILLKKREAPSARLSSESFTKEIKFVWLNGSCDTLINYLKMIEILTDKNSNIKVCSSLQEALDCSCADDTIILPPGEHVVSSMRGIENGGIIKGFDKSDSFIMPDILALPKAILFECFGYIELENLTITKPNGIVIQVFDGVVKLKKCKIMSTENNSTSRGIVVISKSKLFLEDCELRGFGTALALQKDTSASVIRTNIYNCFEGIKIVGNASLLMQDVHISSSSIYGIRIESTEVYSSIPIIGGLNLLQDERFSCNITAESVKFSGNEKGDILIKCYDSLLNLEEFGSADVSTEVICISDGEDEGNDVEEILESFKNSL